MLGLLFLIFEGVSLPKKCLRDLPRISFLEIPDQPENAMLVLQYSGLFGPLGNHRPPGSYPKLL